MLNHSKLFAAIILFAGCYAQASTNFINRVIYRDGDHVRVQDSIRLPLEECRYITVLRPIVEAKEKLSTNLSHAVRDLYAREHVEVEGFAVDIGQNVLELSVSLRIVFTNFHPARLFLVPTYAAKLEPDPPSAQSSQAMMEIFSDGDAHFLWFPAWPDPDDPVRTLANLLNRDFLADRLLGARSDLRVSCVLRGGSSDERELLLDYKPDVEPLRGPNAELLMRLHSTHLISGNDLRRLFTTIKVAKSGYYPLGVNSFTNKLPITLPDGKPLFTANPTFGNGSGGLSKDDPKPSVQIDGRLEDWKSRKSAWTNFTHSADTDLRVFTLENMFYANDSNYLYLFITFQPSVDIRYQSLYPDDKAGSIGNIALLLCNLDSDTKTGFDTKDSPRMGVDAEISVLAGGSFRIQGKQLLSSVPSVSYQIRRWSGEQKEFIPGITHESTAILPLISHGEDGIELAIRRSELGILQTSVLRVIVESRWPRTECRTLSIRLD